MTKCCVKGCDPIFTSDLGNKDKDDPYQNHSMFFYELPIKKALREQWLKALECSDQDVSRNAHVCSLHYRSLRLSCISKDLHKNENDGYPDMALVSRATTTVPAVKLKVCRFCLATGIKMFSLKSGELKTCFETIVGLHENHDVDGLPEYLCYICAAYLLKMYNTIEKSMIAQATLLEIYAENLRITKQLVLEQNRQKLNLIHTLQAYNSTPCKVYEYVYDDKLNTSVLITEKIEIDNNNEDESTTDRECLDLDKSESELTAKSLDNLCMKLKRHIEESEDILTDVYGKPFDAVVGISETIDISYNSSIRRVKRKDYLDTDTSNTCTDEQSPLSKCVNFSTNPVDDKINDANGILKSVKDHNDICVYSGDSLSSKKYPGNSNHVKQTSTQKTEFVKRIKFNRQRDDNLINMDVVKGLMYVDNTISIKYPESDANTSECKFACKFCNLKLATCTALRAHLLDCPASPQNVNLSPPLPKSARRYKCRICGRCFNAHGRLITHLRCVHVPSVPRAKYPVTCKHGSSRSVLLEDKEQASVSTETSKDEIEKISTKEVGHECPICDSTFKSTEMLNQHILEVHQQLQFSSPTKSSTLTKYPELNEVIIREESMEIDSYVKIHKSNKDMKTKNGCETVSSLGDKIFPYQEMLQPQEKDPLQDDSYEDQGYGPVEIFDMEYSDGNI